MSRTRSPLKDIIIPESRRHELWDKYMDELDKELSRLPDLMKNATSEELRTYQTETETRFFGKFGRDSSGKWWFDSHKGVVVKKLMKEEKLRILAAQPA